MFSLNKTTNFLHEPEGKHIAPSLSNLNYWPVNEILEDQYHLLPASTIPHHLQYWEKYLQSPSLLTETFSYNGRKMLVYISFFLFPHCTTPVGLPRVKWMLMQFAVRFMNQSIATLPTTGANTNPQHDNSWKIYSRVNWTDAKGIERRFSFQNIYNPSQAQA